MLYQRCLTGAYSKNLCKKKLIPRNTRTGMLNVIYVYEKKRRCQNKIALEKPETSMTPNVEDIGIFKYQCHRCKKVEQKSECKRGKIPNPLLNCRKCLFMYFGRFLGW